MSDYFGLDSLAGPHLEDFSLAAEALNTGQVSTHLRDAECKSIRWHSPSQPDFGNDVPSSDDAYTDYISTCQ